MKKTLTFQEHKDAINTMAYVATKPELRCAFDDYCMKWNIDISPGVTFYAKVAYWYYTIHQQPNKLTQEQINTLMAI